MTRRGSPHVGGWPYCVTTAQGLAGVVEMNGRQEVDAADGAAGRPAGQTTASGSAGAPWWRVGGLRLVAVVVAVVLVLGGAAWFVTDQRAQRAEAERVALELERQERLVAEQAAAEQAALDAEADREASMAARRELRAVLQDQSVAVDYSRWGILASEQMQKRWDTALDTANGVMTAAQPPAAEVDAAREALLELWPDYRAEVNDMVRSDLVDALVVANDAIAVAVDDRDVDVRRNAVVVEQAVANAERSVADETASIVDLNWHADLLRDRAQALDDQAREANSAG